MYACREVNGAIGGRLARSRSITPPPITTRRQTDATLTDSLLVSGLLEFRQCSALVLSELFPYFARCPEQFAEYQKCRAHFGAPVPSKSPPRARYKFTRSRRREARICVSWTFAATFSPVRRKMVNMSICPCSSCCLPNFTESALLETASPSAPSRLRR